MAELSVGPTANKIIKIDINDTKKCIFCGKLFKKNAQSATYEKNKLDSLFNACEKRNDNVGFTILSNKSAVLNGDITLKYHRNCRSTYVSSLHIKRLKDKNTYIFISRKSYRY